MRPRCVFPLVVFGEDGEVVLLAPLDRFHEQTVAVVEGEGEGKEGRLRWGWVGGLERVERGFETRLVALRGNGMRDVLEKWGRMVVGGCGVEMRGAYADVSVAKVSMWTDNGAAYWYRREKDMSVLETLESCMGGLEEQGVPIGSVEFDSWFYEHEVKREVTEVGYLDVVPPTGLMRWEPREDVLGKGGVKGLREKIGGRPLVLHSRHISSSSPYLNEEFHGGPEGDVEWDGSSNSSSSGSGGSTKGDKEGKEGKEFMEETVAGWWVDKDRAHPANGGAGLWERWMESAADWGCTAYEQDWLVEIWLGIKQLREVPGRVAAWQHAMNDAATNASNMALIWCMATPADMAAATGLSRVVAVRSCDDYRYAKDPAVLWKWHLTTSVLLRSLGLWAFKDVFLSSSNGKDKVDIDGDPNAELEAALAALSGGPVAIGDRIGRTDKNVVRRTCRVDGTIIKPDMPLAALNRSLSAAPDASPLIWADTTCCAGGWRYILVVHAGHKSTVAANGGVDPLICEALSLADDTSNSIAEDSAGRVVYDWRTRTAAVQKEVKVELRTHEWALFVVCPTPKADCVTLVGDVDVYATMGQRRWRAAGRGGRSLEVTGVPGETVRVAAWSQDRGLCLRDVIIPPAAWTRVGDSEEAWADADVVPAVPLRTF